MYLNVLSQVSVLLILITLGFILAKVKVLNEVGVKCMTDLVLFAVTPSVIAVSFMRPFEKSAAKSLLLSTGVAVMAHIVFILLSTVIVKDKEVSEMRVLRFAAIFGNYGFMALPLQQAILGSEGVFYGSSVVAVFNIFVWSYGILLMSGDKKYVKLKTMILNPNIIAIIMGIVIFVFSVRVPEIIKSPLNFLAGLNTPLPMIIIGYHLSKSDILGVLRKKKALLVCGLKLILFPLISVFVMYGLGVRGIVPVSLTIAFASPVAAMTAMFSQKFSNDTPLAAEIVSISHILAIITMPVIIYLAQLIF